MMKAFNVNTFHAQGMGTAVFSKNLSDPSAYKERLTIFDFEVLIPLPFDMQPSAFY